MNTVEERRIELRLRQMFEAVAQDTTADVPPIAFMSVGSEAVRAFAPHSRSHRLWRLVAAFAVVVVLAGAVALAALNQSSDTHSGVTASPTSFPQRDRHPSRVALPLPDGSFGWMNTKALSPPSIEGLDYSEGLARLKQYQHTLIPVTQTVDPKSRRIGYYLISVGFVPLVTARTPAVSVDGLVAHGRCAANTQVVLIDGSYQCVEPTGPKLGSRLR